MRFLLVNIVLLLSTYFGFAQKAESTILDLSDGFIRYEVHFMDSSLEFEICNLKVGSVYEIRSLGKNDCAPNIIFSKSQKGTFTYLKATDDCEVFTLQPSNVDCKAPFWLSVVLADDESIVDKNDTPEFMANLSVAGGQTAQALIEDIFIGGGCFDVSNVTSIGSSQGRGIFSSGNSTIGLETGVILSTGNINNAPGPNDDDGAGNNLPGGGGDPDLNILAAGGNVTDVTGIEFDFTPTVGTIDFNYVFASEEYCEYVGSTFNDVFGFFISGPGISGGFTLSGENIAVLPGSGIAVAINNVNHISNTGYFVPNNPDCNATTNMTEIQFDGWTSVLTATATVTPCETYHIRLLIGDVGDSIYDSAVFLEANSFSAGGSAEGEAIAATTGTNLVYESCNDGVITFTRSGDLSMPMTISWTIDPSSTATPGVDYDALPTSVTIPAGQASVDVILNVIADLIVEGIETIILNIDNTCSCTNSTLEIQIDDPPLLEATLDDQEICEGESVTLSPTVEAELDITGYEWTPANSGSSITETPTTPTTYTVTVTDECGGTDTASAVVNVIPMATAEISGGGTLCAGTGDTVHLVINFTGDPEWTFTPTLNGSPQAPITTSENPYILVISEVGTYGISDLTSGAGGCPGTTSGSVTIEESEITPSAVPTAATCTQENGSIDLTPSGGTAPYIYEWNNGDTDEDLDDIGPGTYTVTVTDDFGCTGTLSITVDDQPNEPSPSVSTTLSICGFANGDIDLTVSGGDPPYTFNWNNGSTDEDLEDVAPGSYTVTVTGADGCTAELTVELENENPPISIASEIEPNTACPPIGGDGSISISVSPSTAPGGGSYDVTWSNGGGGFSQNDLPPGSYSVTVSAGGECSEVASFEVPDEPNLPSLSADPTPSLCGLANGDIDLTVSGGEAPFTFQWDNGSTDEDLTDVTPGSYCVTVTGANGCSAETCVTLPNENPPISINADIGPNTACPPIGGNGSISISVSPATSPGGGSYDVTWSNGGSGFSQNDLPSGSYSVTVSAGGECSEVASFEVPDEPNLPTLSADPTPSLCGLANGDVDLTVSGGEAPYTYQWDNGSTDEDLADVTPGSYCVTVTGANGCSAETCVTLPNENPPISINADIGPNTACPPIGGNGSISISVSPATSPGGGSYDVTWSNGGSGFSQNDLPPGSYSVTVSAGGECSEVASFEVPDEPNLPEIISEVSPTLCGLGNGSIDISIAGGVAPFNIVWSNGEMGTPIEDITSGTYSVTVTGENGCSVSTSISVPDEGFPINIVSNVFPNTVCPPNLPNGSISISVTPTFLPAPLSNYDVTWSNGGSGFSQSDLPPGTYSVTVSAGENCSQTATFSVSDQPDEPQLSPSALAATCGESNGEATISVSGGEAPFTYQWSNGGNGPSIPNVAGGNYTVTVTGANGCSAVASVNVPDNPIPISILPDITPNISCEPPGDGAINVTVNPPTATITWSNGMTGTNISHLAPGTYSVTVDAGGTCVETAIFTVPDESEIPTLSTVPSPSTCNEDDGAVTLEVFGGVPPFQFQWSNGATEQNLSNIFSGQYTVTVTSAAGCTAVTSVNVPNNEILFNVSGQPTGNTSCGSPNGLVQLQVNPPGNYTYQWSNGETTPFLSEVPAGSYSVTVSAGGSCEQVAVYTVFELAFPPNVSASTVAAICGQNNGSVNLNVEGNSPPFQFQWSNGTTTEDLINVPPGTYLVTVTDANDCTAETVANVGSDNIPINLMGVPTPNLSCILPNGEIDLIVSPPGTYSYVWSNGETTEDLSNLTEGMYSVTVSAGGNCSSTATYIVANMTLEPQIVEEISAAICGEPNGGIDLSILPTSGGPYDIIWSNGETTEDLSNLLPGDYEATVTGANGCTSTALFNVPNNSSNFTLSADATPDNQCDTDNGAIDLTVTPAGAYTIQWSNGETTEDLSNLPPGTYDVTVTESGSCEATASFFVADETSYPTISQTIEAEICGQENGAVDLEVSGGAAPYIFEWSNGESTEDLSDLPSAVYLVTVTEANGCTGTAVANVPENSISIDLTGSPLANTSCDVVNGAIELSVDPPGTYVYEWSNGATSQNISGLAGGSYSVTVSAGGDCSAIATFTVPSTTADPVLAQTITPSICGEDNGAIDLEVTAGEAPFSFEWSNGETTEDLYLILANAYSVTVTGANGCQSIATFNVPDNPVILTIEGITAPNTSCDVSTGEIDIDVTPLGAYDFVWSNGQATEDLSNLAAGNYTVTVYEGATCQAEANFIVGNDTSAPDITPTISAAKCSQATGGIDLLPSGGTTPYSFEWSNGETSEDLEDILPGDYTVTVTGADGCSNTGSFTVPDDLITIDINGTPSANTTCLPLGNPNGGIEIDILPTGNYNIEWSNGETVPILSELEPGNYEVTVSAGGDCSSVTSFQVPNNPDEPSLTDEVVPSICGQPDGGIDLEVMGGAAPFIFEWSNGEMTEDLTDLLSGDYSVTVTAANGCVAEATMNVPNLSNTFFMSASITANTLCQGANGNINLSIDPPGTYAIEWSNGETTEDLDELASGTYTVTVTDDGGCFVSQTFIVPNQSPTPSLTGESVDILCFGENTGAIDLTIEGGTEPYQIEWSPSIIGNPEDPTELAAGDYSVTVTDVAGCASEMEFLISQPADYVGVVCSQVTGVSIPGGTDGSASVSISGGQEPYIVVWSPGGIQAGVPEGVFEILNLPEGQYDVTVGDANGCQTNCDFLISGCQTTVGSMSNAVLDLCGEGCLSANYDALGQFLEPEDTLEFILHTGSGNVIVNEIARSDEPTFCFDPSLMSFEETYFISAVAGNDDGTGSVDLTDDCTVVSWGTPIVFHEIPVASLNQPGPITCDGLDVNLNGNSTIPGSIFDWSASGGGVIAGNPTSSNVMAQAEGNYTLIVTSPHSLCADTVAVDVNDLSTDINVGIVASPNEILDCMVSFITLDGTATGSTNLMYEWSGASGMISSDASINVTEGGIYQFVAFDPLSNCADTATVEIMDNSDFPPLFLDQAPFLDCMEPTGEISGGSLVPDVQLQWATIEGGDTTILGAGPTLSVNEPGTYWLFGTADNGCENGVSITVNGDFSLPSANAGDDQSLDCFQNEIELNGSSNSVDVSFEWSCDNPNVVISNPDFPTITVSEAGVYTLTVTALGNGCTAIDEVVVDLYENIPQGILDLNEPDCYGDENGSITVLTDPANGPYTYSLDGVSNGILNTFYPLSSGNYLIEVTDGIGCTWTTEVFLSQPNPLQVELGGDLLVELGDEVTVQVQYTVPTSQLDTILWQPSEELPCPQMPCDVQVFSPVEQSIISVTVIDNNGCMADDLMQLFVRKDRSIYIPNAFSPNGNGINDVFMIYASDDVVKIKEFLVYSRWGESVFEYYNFEPNNPAYGWDGKHRGKELDPAVFAYFAIVEFVDGQEVLFEGDVTLMK